jgi:DNA-binding NarL/FixJ family response regulator
MAIKVVICDDDRLITDSLKFIFNLDDRFEVLEVFNQAKKAIDYCIKHQVDVILQDIRMPDVNGVEATKQIVAHSKTKVLILTTFDEDNYIEQCFEYGAKGYLLKNNPPEMIMNAVVNVDGGNIVVEDKVMQRMSTKSNKNEKLTDLTKREKEIVIKISEGLTNREIGEELFISEGTVKNNITSILSKLNLKHRTQIAIYYLSD